MTFVAELKRRNVIRVAIAYVAVSWLVMQVCTLGVQVLELPNTISKGLLVLLAIGFIPALVFSWVYELTPEGLKKEREIERDESITHLTGRKLDYIVIGVLGAIVALLLVDKFVVSPRLAAKASEKGTEVVKPLDQSTKSGSGDGLTTSVPLSDGIPAIATDPSIAVLPLVNMSDDKANEYFSDGISEELLNLLAKIPQLEVTARTSSFAFKGKETGIPDIARTLRVAHVLEGSVRKSGNSVRITAQLIKAATGNHVWSQTYDRKLDDVFAIQDEIAADVVKQLQVTLLGAAPKARTTNPEAYAMYLQAMQLNRLNTADSLEQADALYAKVLAIDPRYAAAWVGLAETYYRQVGNALLPNTEGLAKARDAASRALEIDPAYAPAYAHLGRIASVNNDLVGAAQHLKRALELDATDLEVQYSSSVLLTSLGRIDEAVTLEEAIVRRDPVNVNQLYYLGLHQRNAGRFDAAVATQRTVLSLSPGRGGAHAELALALVQKGDAQGALAEIDQEKNEAWKAISLPIVCHAAGRKADSDAALAALVAKFEKDASFNIAYVYAFRGEPDKAFEWLDKAVAYNDPGLGEVVMERLFDKIRADPRWLPFLRKIGKAPEQLAKIEFEVPLPGAAETAKGSAP
jgi:TolB-like protein/cytochrome c-type biogenesis protein CcmH/NrfG